ncbi:TauD/TfdA family dioxygenase [Pantoea allii]|nr:TauD/TfdA family dioxygenase [Pantoea allii]THB82210.1 TauD/TfdA family dioxygenase [Pantoea allii]
MNENFEKSYQAQDCFEKKLVTTEPLSSTHKSGIIISPTIDDFLTKDFLTENLSKINSLLSENGAILLRGFKVSGPDEFRNVVEATKESLLNYTHRSTPRKIISEGVFSSTEYPEEQSIPQHNEMSYTLSWPKKIFFYCYIKPTERGQTPIANSKKVYQRLPKDLIERFEKRGVMYVRNYGHGIDLSWQDVFQTNDRLKVESYCFENNIQFEWLDEKHLRTKQVCQASIRDTISGEGIWFNQAHLFHISNLPKDIENYLRRQYSEDQLPRNALLGDGSPITIEDLNLIRSAYKEEEIVFDWEENDILILDNETMSHGRCPFRGPRSILVSMT